MCLNIISSTSRFAISPRLLIYEFFLVESFVFFTFNSRRTRFGIVYVQPIRELVYLVGNDGDDGDNTIVCIVCASPANGSILIANYSRKYNFRRLFTLCSGRLLNNL